MRNSIIGTEIKILLFLSKYWRHGRKGVCISAHQTSFTFVLYPTVQADDDCLLLQRLTDTSLYGGTHKARFDSSGRGKGVSGRRELKDLSPTWIHSPRKVDSNLQVNTFRTFVGGANNIYMTIFK